ncbi:unnamed protein product [Adineta ricciae]|uniref:Uncharacterized protein n=1 Tax=Adineta ricciae TaxID=249248 RepID=A0A815YSN1_ADIRI|nr:unnamed protein product [Adineta ricciae]
MSIDSKRDSINEDHIRRDVNSSSDNLTEQKDDNQLQSSPTNEINRPDSQLGSPKLTRSHSHSSISSKHTRQSEKSIVRPTSPVTRQRDSKDLSPVSSKPKQRTRSNSPRKTFSYLPPDRMNVRAWKQQHRQLAKQDEYDRIYHENRIKLERLAKIVREPSSYPTMHIEQERQRERHALDHRRKVLKSYIPIYQDNLFIINRLANVKGVYDTKKMEEDFRRHTGILQQDAANRKKARETAAQRPFILPKINTKS